MEEQQVFLTFDPPITRELKGNRRQATCPHPKNYPRGEQLKAELSDNRLWLMEPPDQTHVTNGPLKQELVNKGSTCVNVQIGGPSEMFGLSPQLCFHTLLSSLCVSLTVLFCFNEESLGLKQAEVFVRTGPDPSAACSRI